MVFLATSGWIHLAWTELKHDPQQEFPSHGPNCLQFVNISLIYFPESPSFTKTPSPVEGIKGKDASLHCEVYGTPPFQVSWYKDKRPLKESRKYKMVSEGSSATIHIMKLEQDDAGLYECKVSNNVGSGSCRTTISLKG